LVECVARVVDMYAELWSEILNGRDRLREV